MLMVIENEAFVEISVAKIRARGNYLLIESWFVKVAGDFEFYDN